MAVNDKLKVLVMGLGRGQALARVTANSAILELAGIIDPNRQRLADVGRTTGASSDRQFENFEQAAGAVKADILVVATPTKLHRDHVLAGLRAGLHVLCEKPLATSREDAQAMLDESRKQGRQVAVVQNARYTPQYRKCRELVTQGLIGIVSYAEIRFRRWRTLRGLAHAVLMNHGVHHLDVVRSIVGGTPVSVHAFEWDPAWALDLARAGGPGKADGCGFCVRFTAVLDTGCVVTYDGSYAESGKATPQMGELRLIGSKGALETRGESDFNPQVWLFRLPAVAGEEIESRIPVAPLSYDEYDRAILEGFAQAIRAGGTAETDIEDNVKTLEWLFMAQESIETGVTARRL